MSGGEAQGRRRTSDRHPTVQTRAIRKPKPGELVPDKPSRRWIWLAALAVAMGGLLAWRLFAGTAAAEASLEALPPRAYLRPQDAGYDHGKVRFASGAEALRVRLDTPDGPAYPAYTHPDPKVVPQVDGRRYVFPLIPGGEAGPSTPLLPPALKPLPPARFHELEPFRRP